MNVQLSFNAQFVLFTSLAGIIGALGMMLVIGLFGRVGWTRANLVVALGHLFVRPPKQALIVGALIHCLAGIVFAMIYTTIFLIIDLQHPALIILAGHVSGFIHGVFMSLIFVVAAVLSNPEGELRKVQFSGGPTYLLGHLVYGTLVGIVIALSPL